jgi:hypothetical protein
MCKKLISLVSVIFMLGLASITYGIQLGDFENTMDGWVEDEDDNVLSIDYSDTNGVTLGTYSLKVVTVANPAGADVNALAYDVIGNGMLEEFKQNLKVSLDITRRAEEWVVDPNASTWSDFAMIVRAGSESGTPWKLSEHDAMAAQSDAHWMPDDGNDPLHLVLNYSMAHTEIDYNNLEYLDIVIKSNWDGFDPGGAYYFDNIQMFGAGQAYDPDPNNTEREVRGDAILSWIPGVYADKHDVYFGTDYSDVNDANTSDTTGVYRGRRDANNYDPPGFLESAETYYWRIDEVNGPNIWKGDVWQFTTAYPGPAIVIGDWEQNMDGWEAGWEGSPVFDYNQTPETVTLGKYSLGVKWESKYWVLKWTAPTIPETLANTTLMFDLTAFGSDFEDWAKCADKIALNSNGPDGWKEYDNLATAINRNTGESEGLDWGNWDEIVERTYSLDISDYDVSGATWFNINVSLQVSPEGRDHFGKAYFDNARFVDLRLASNPDPANYATDAKREPTLSWTPGNKAATHDIYFGTNFDDVNDASRASPLGVLVRQDQAYDANTYAPGILAFDKNYYWRIDEVNESDICKGDIWVFTIGQYIVVDDFEDYNDFTPDKIFQTWKDGQGYSQPVPGYPGNGTGSAVGSNAPPWAEQSIVHGDSQSMPIKYVNDGSTGKALYSEIFRQWDTPQDWTAENVKALSLWFRGYPATEGSYSYNPAEDKYTVTAAGWDISGRADDFYFIYKELTGNATITARVDYIEDTAIWAKAGVMIRDHLDADSSNASVCVIPRGRMREFKQRYEYKGESTEAASEPNTISIPYWVRLHRDRGTPNLQTGESMDAFTAYYSTDGINWGDPEIAEESVVMTDPVYVGLAYTSFAPSTFGQAVFSNVSIDGVPFQATDSQDIPNNDAEQLYVVIEDATNANTVIEHDDPNAVLLDTWTPWLINLQDIADAGVDLGNIKTMYIGVGDRDNPVSGGTGKLYFDDIRLLIPQCPAGDLNDDCTVDYLDLKALADGWLGTGADLDENGTVDFIDYALLAETWLGEEILSP